MWLSISYQVSGLVPSIWPPPYSSQSHTIDKYGCQCHIRYQVLYLVFDLRPIPPKVIQLINTVVNVISGIRSCTSYLTFVPFLPKSYNWSIWLSMSYQVSGLVPLIWHSSPSSQNHTIDKYGCHCHIRYQVLYLLFDLHPLPPKWIQLKEIIVIVISGIRSYTSYLTSALFLSKSYNW